MDDGDEQPHHSSSSDHHSNQKKKTSVLIQIPSYEEVIGNTQPKSTAPPSLFVPSQTFSQAFAAIKNTEFYTPPPSTTTTATSSSSSRKTGQPEASPSVSARPSTSTNSIHKTNAILVSQRQKGNPLLKYIRNVRWNFAEVIPDFVLGANSCALYLSLRYHLLHPDYLYFRIRELQKNFRLRLVLCHVDVEDVVKPLLEVTRTAMFHDCTLLCGWSLEECGRYLETIKVYENKPADIIQGHMDTDYLSRLNHALTTIRHVNKTDVVTLGSTFGSLAHIMDASMEDLASCPGIGERKVKRLYDTFHEPFKRIIPVRAVNIEAPSENKTGPELPTTEPLDPKEETSSKIANKKKKIEPEITVKSALSAAFAKYMGKLGNKSDRTTKEMSEGTVNEAGSSVNAENSGAETAV